MTMGTVQWFNLKVGYGFIQSVDGKSFFVHYSDIEVDGLKTLKAGQVVEFVQIICDQSIRASKVVPK